MSRPYRDKNQLFWTICRIDLFAGLASTAAAFTVVFGVPLLITLGMMITGLEFERLAPNVQLGISIGVVLVFFVVGPATMWAARVGVYRWKGAACPNCGRRFGSARQENETIASGYCLRCRFPLTDESPDISTG
jgi:hypothetical protein